MGSSTRRLGLIIVADTSFGRQVLREARFVDRLASSQYRAFLLGAHILTSLLEVGAWVVVVRTGDFCLLSELCRVFDGRYLLESIKILASGVVFRG